jgi:hypothetical protein
LKYELLNVIGLFPIFYYPYRWAKSGQRPAILKKQVEFVIEGYPRSGNTFAREAFGYAQKRSVIVASHSHSPAQVKFAVKKRLPLLILIRNPTDAVISTVIRNPDKSIKQSLRHYSNFYSTILPLRQSFLIGTFEELCSDFGALVERVNLRFQVEFQPFIHSQKNVANTFILMEKELQETTGQEKVDEALIARPSSIRAEMKNDLLREINSTRYASLLCDAENWYRIYLDFHSKTK